MLNVIVTLKMLSGDLADRFDRREDGATAVEYGLMVALIAVVIIAAVRLIGTNLTAIFNNVAGALT